MHSTCERAIFICVRLRMPFLVASFSFPPPSSLPTIFSVFLLLRHISFSAISSKTHSRHPPTSSLSPSNSISVRMAQPSSSHYHSHRDRSDRNRSHRHQRSISSTTLLLVLYLILAVLAVILSLPSQHNPVTPAPVAHPAVLDPEPSINEDTPHPKGPRLSLSTNVMLLSVKLRSPVARPKFSSVLLAVLGTEEHKGPESIHRSIDPWCPQGHGHVQGRIFALLGEAYTRHCIPTLNSTWMQPLRTQSTPPYSP